MPHEQAASTNSSGNPLGVVLIVLGCVAIAIALVVFIVDGHSHKTLVEYAGLGGLFTVILGGIIAS